MKTLIAAAFAAALAVTPAIAQEAPIESEAETAPAPVEAPQVLVVKSTATIVAPRVLEVDGTVSCSVDGDVLRCTAARNEPGAQ